MAEIGVLAGFEVVVIDNEHGQAGLETTLSILRAIEAAGGMPVVRVPWNDPVCLKRILELGAASLMIPMIESAAEAKAAVEACRYPPRGRRGYAASISRGSGYGTDPDYIHHAHDDLLLMLQIESAAAASEIDAIAAVDGADMLFIGSNDMAGSINHLERLDAPAAAELIGEAEAAVAQSGRWLATVPRAGISVPDLWQRGHRLLVGPSDIALVRDGCRAERRAMEPPKA